MNEVVLEFCKNVVVVTLLGVLWGHGDVEHVGRRGEPLLYAGDSRIHTLLTRSLLVSKFLVSDSDFDVVFSLLS